MTDFDNIEPLDWDKGGGLLPAIVQDAGDGRVLMLGYMNAAALEQTLSSGLVTFYSRSKERLWIKGETSGHSLELKAIAADCDRDTLLIQATARGPACHLGSDTCFGNTAWPPVGFLARLERIIETRRDADPAISYTARLVAEGSERCAQKLGEEGVETALAVARSDPETITSEAADLIYHLLVCLGISGVELRQVAQELGRRRADSQPLLYSGSTRQ